MQQHPFDILAIENGGKIIFTPCPGTKSASLVDSVTTLKEAETNLLITLMFDEEMERLGVTTLANVCKEQHIDWLQLPIVDDAAPNEFFQQQWQLNKDNVLNVLSQHGTVAVHCKGGSGRTGLVIALILSALGWPKAKIIETVQGIRPNALKSTVQRDYFEQHAS